MNEKKKVALEEEEVVVDADTVEVAYDDYPNAEESGEVVDLGISGEPEPFDPYDVPDESDSATTSEN